MDQRFGITIRILYSETTSENNYQELMSKGKPQIGAFNTYTGFVYTHSLQNDLILRGKGILSYSLVHQGKVKEKDGLNLDIEAKDYHYVDGELGVSLAKTLYDDSKKYIIRRNFWNFWIEWL